MFFARSSDSTPATTHRSRNGRRRIRRIDRRSDRRDDRRGRYRLGRLESLETRIALDAKFSFGGSTVTINQFTEMQSETLVVWQSRGAVSFRLTEGMWTDVQSTEARLINPQTVRLDAPAAESLMSITVNDGSVGDGADPGIDLRNLDLPDVAVTLNGTGTLLTRSVAGATLDSLVANVSDARMTGVLGIDDDGSIKITTEGDLFVSGEIRAEGSTIELTVGDQLTGDGVITTSPEFGDGGNIMVSLSDGSDFGGRLDASGGVGQTASGEMAAMVGGSGGNITVSRQSSGTSPVVIDELLSVGGRGGPDFTQGERDAGAGGDGGGITVTVNGDGDFESSRLDNSGGVGGYRSAAAFASGGGGTAGNINVNVGGVMMVGEVISRGGPGAASTAGGNAGDGGGGGAITLQSAAMDGSGVTFERLDARGGRGGRVTDNSSSADAGAGGDAGNISIDTAGSSIDGQVIIAYGGDGGESLAGQGGNGGSGNTVTIAAGAIDLRFIGVLGGNGGSSDSGAGGNGGNGGNGGDGGGLSVSGDDRVAINRLSTSGGNGVGGQTTSNGGTAGNASIQGDQGEIDIDEALAEGGRGENNGGGGGTLTFEAVDLILGRLSVDGGVGVNGTDGDDGSIQR